MNEENVAIRLKGFIDHLGLSSSQFADQCGIPRPSLSQLLNGRNKKISDILVGQIHTAYPELNVVWLLFGEGSMLNSPPDSDSNAYESKEDGVAQFTLEEDGSENKINLQSGVASSKIRAVGGTEVTEKAIAERDLLIEELRKEIAQLKRNPRKVSQITVYYDDSTFETFYPSAGQGKGR